MIKSMSRALPASHTAFVYVIEGNVQVGGARTAVSAGQLVHWVADWVSRGGETWRKPTHFEVRDGKF